MAQNSALSTYSIIHVCILTHTHTLFFCMYIVLCIFIYFYPSMPLHLYLYLNVFLLLTFFPISLSIHLFIYIYIPICIICPSSEYPPLNTVGMFLWVPCTLLIIFLHVWIVLTPNFFCHFVTVACDTATNFMSATLNMNILCNSH